MPIYEYTCSSCHARFDQLQRTMSAAAEESRPACPTCGSPQTSRSLSVFAVAADTAAGKSNEPAAAGGMCGCGRVPGSCGMG